jgi:hypothetical protein
MRRLIVAHGTFLSLATGVACAATVLLVPGGLAQTPTSAASPADHVPHPVQIQAGTCEALGEIVISLDDMSPPPAEATREGPASAHDVTVSQALVDASLQEMIEGGHAINVAESTEASDVSIACGDIGGIVTTDHGGRTELFIGLAERNESGSTGIARFGVGDDPNQTEVVVMLIEPETMR